MQYRKCDIDITVRHVSDNEKYLDVSDMMFAWYEVDVSALLRPNHYTVDQTIIL